MARKILYGILIGFSGLLMILSLVGIGAVWAYNGPFTDQAVTRLGEVAHELDQAESALANAERELERALRILEGVQVALDALNKQTAQAGEVLGGIETALDDRLIPGLETATDKIDQVRLALQGALTTLQTMNSLPFLNLDLPGEELLQGLLQATDTLDTEIGHVQEIADLASTYLDDASYLLGGDLTDTRQSVEDLLSVVQEYRSKLSGWRQQVIQISERLPSWVDQVSIGLTLFLIWFAISQFGLLLHGVGGFKGGNPLAVLRTSTPGTG